MRLITLMLRRNSPDPNAEQTRSRRFPAAFLRSKWTNGAALAHRTRTCISKSRGLKFLDEVVNSVSRWSRRGKILGPPLVHLGKIKKRLFGHIREARLYFWDAPPPSSRA